MKWMIYVIGGLAVGACVMALYEWRKSKSAVSDEPYDPALGNHHGTSERAAYTRAEQIRAEGQMLNPPGGGGGIF